jgi:hypothetical protein
MGMTIEEAIEHGKEQLEIFGGEHNEFIQTAISTMRKYQKIEQIVSDRYGKPMVNFMDAIVKVVEDGKDNK